MCMYMVIFSILEFDSRFENVFFPPDNRTSLSYDVDLLADLTKPINQHHSRELTQWIWHQGIMDHKHPLGAKEGRAKQNV